MMSSSSPAQAASGPDSAAQMMPRSREAAAIAAGSTPAVGVSRPSSASSPSTRCRLDASEGIAPIAAISPSAIGRS